jgi:small subunit ribosomal protein S29
MPKRLVLRHAPSPIDISLLLRRNPSNPFSTTCIRSAGGQRTAQGPRKGVKSLVISRKAPAVIQNPPHPGERKAFKNRIILSNTNAVEAPGLHTLSAENIANESTLGKVMAIPGPVVDSLRVLGAFKRSQGWSNYRRPACLMTAKSWELGRKIADITRNNLENEHPASSMRRVIHGPRKSGKSVLVLQAMTMAILNQWVVFNIPQCKSSLPSR